MANTQIQYPFNTLWKLNQPKDKKDEEPKPEVDERAAATAIDARVSIGIATVCEFVGYEFSPGKLHRCKFYTKSYYRSCCQWCYNNIDAKLCGKVGD